MRHLHDHTEGEAPASQKRSNGWSNFTPERVGLLVLSCLLAAAVFVICRLALDIVHTKRRLETLMDDRNIVLKDVSAFLRNCQDKKCNNVQRTCLQPPVADTIESCLKCEEGWEPHGDKCYYFSNNSLSWEEARRECRRGGGDLVKIDSREEQSFLQQKLREKMTEDEDKFWIGLTDSQEEGKWLWVDGSPLSKSLTFWSRGEPDNWLGEDPDGEDCVRMGGKYGLWGLNSWFDKSCKASQNSICEKSAETGHQRCVCNVVKG